MSELDELARRVGLLEGMVARLQVDMRAVKNGWLPAGQWTYASSSTITEAGDVRSRYPVGTQVSYVQGGVQKWGVVIGSAYAAPVTTLTITGGSDYSVANAPITEPMYSYSAPAKWFNWVPSLTGGAADLSGYTRAQFTIRDRMCHIEFVADNRSITGAGLIQISLPVTTTSTTGLSHQFFAAMFNGAAYVPVRAELPGQVGYINLHKDFISGPFAGTETGYYFRIWGGYPI